ncbi:cobalt-zinc-cadmium resistance protein [hydrocarbon metagenome]|uniref:Cobalt-zinc-cadmium resistance protein n=1 Tax=hydrocarbon metagenome TaxID=938273 RepID=A0A0W8FWB2_9ZZZZ
MAKSLHRATTYSILVNLLLFILKAVVGFISNSIAVISEAVNSLTDIISSVAIKYAVKVSSKKPDETHQFGHNAAQPIAAFIVAVFAFVVGIKIVEESIKRIISPEEITIHWAIYIVLSATIVIKIMLSKYQKIIEKKYTSPAMNAAGVDSLNDVLASAIALVGVICVDFGFRFVDGIAGILVAVFIFKTGWEVAKENIDYLMGKSADDKLIFEIANKALKIEGVEGLNDLRSHYVGDKFHIEIHVEVNKDISTIISHDIGKKVKFAIEDMDEVQKVFVHIDPV